MAADPWEIDWLDLRTKSVEPVDGESVLVVHAPDILRYSPNLVEEEFCELRLYGILASPVRSSRKPTHLSVSPLPKPSACWPGSPGVLEISSAGGGAGTNSKRASYRQC